MAIILDTGYLFALNNNKDLNHDIVKLSYTHILDGKFGVPYLLDYVFDELMTLIQVRTNNNQIATEIGNYLLQDADEYIQFSRISETDFIKAWELFQNQSGSKFLSFTDSIIIAFSQSLKIGTVATLDNQFKSWTKTIP